MGVYLSEPKTQKETKTEENTSVRYTSTEMQGWRKNMEDSRICELSVKAGNKTYCVFGVFDGHGGILTASSQEQKCPSLSRLTSWRSSSLMKIFRRATSKQRSSKPSTAWTRCSRPLKEIIS